MKSEVIHADDTEKQVDIHRASFRVVQETPGHVTYGVWINGGKSGELTVRQEERIAFQIMMFRAGFDLTEVERDEG